MRGFNLRDKDDRHASRLSGFGMLVLMFIIALVAAGGVAEKSYLDGLIEPYSVEVEAKEPKPMTLQEEIEEFGSYLFEDDWWLMKRIIKCESGFRPEVVSHTNDTGLTQINWVHGIRNDWLKDWRINLTVASKLFRDQGTGPWYASKHCWKY